MECYLLFIVITTFIVISFKFYSKQGHNNVWRETENEWEDT